MASFDIRLFGAIEIRRDGAMLTDFRSQKALVLLAYLICENRPVTRDYLAGLAWPEMEQRQALGLLRRSLHDVHSQLPGCLELERRTVCFSPTAPATVDIHTFATLLVNNDVAGWTASAAFYHAPFLHGIYVDDAPDLENWLLRQQEQWQQTATQVLLRLIRHHADETAYELALGYVQQLLALEPWREEAQRQAMLLLARTGQVSAALAQYERCRHILQAELAVEPAPETQRLYAQIKAIAQAPAPNLLAATTPFMGRSAEVADLLRLLANPNNRLLTLLAPGGMGKTRLALEVARHVVSEQRRVFLQGVCVVALAAADSTAQLVATLAQALTFTVQPQGSAADQVIRYLREKELLLVLDNFEQLIDSASLAFVTKLLQMAPAVKLLVTSRVRLNLQGEQLYWLQGLPVPAAQANHQPLPLTDVTQYSSLQLFVESAQRVHSSYLPSAEDIFVIVAICQLVQGMPLAIELAAAWTAVLSPAKIISEMRRTLDFLASEMHDLPLRQRSMRAVFDTSWRLLAPKEQTVFQQLSIFRGGFTLAAAQAVAGATLPVLLNLIHKSFLRRTPDERYQIHELLRQFAEEKLAGIANEQIETQNRHGDYYLTFVLQRALGLMGAQQTLLLNELGQEIDNIRAGWLYTAELGKIEQLEGALDGLHEYYQMRSQYDEGIELFRQSIQAQQRVGTHVRTAQQIVNRIQARQGALCCELGRYEDARTFLQESLAMARRLHDNKEIAFCLEFMGRTVWWQESGAAAQPLLEESLRIRRAIGDRVGLAAILDILALMCDMSSEFSRAKHYAEQGLVVSYELGHTYRIANILRRLASVAVGFGDYATAVARYQEALQTFRQLDDQHGIVSTLAEMGRAMYGSGEFAQENFMQVLEEAATLARKLGDYIALFYGVGILGDVANWVGEYETAERCGQELLELSRHRSPTFLASCLRIVGEASLGLGKLHLARQQLLESMTVMLKSETRLLINCQMALMAWAKLLYRECTAQKVAHQPCYMQQQAQALEIVSSLWYEPKARAMYKARAAQFASELEALLPPEVARAAKERGKTKTPVQMATEIVNQM